jgi:hypothetical protein
MRFFRRKKETPLEPAPILPPTPLFRFDFKIEENAALNQPKINLSFDFQPGMEKFIAEFIFRLRTDDKLWLKLYDTMIKKLDEKSIKIIQDELAKHYSDLSKDVDDILREQLQNSDQPVISPLK